MAKKLAAVVRARQKAGAYRNVTRGSELARTLTEDLFAVAHDKHLRLSLNWAPAPAPSTGPLPPDMQKELQKENGAISKVEILEGNIGYMRVNGVPDLEFARPAVAAAFAFLANTDALIIDSRDNGGGDPNTVALYVSYLSEGKPFVVNAFHWREGNRVEEFRTTELGGLAYGAKKPVFVLTSSMTFSGGEELAYDLQALKRAVIVGETTGGGANPSEPVALPHNFSVSMPFALAVNPVTGRNWEGVGVTPDVQVSAADALKRAHRLALERLATIETGMVAKADLEGVEMKLATLEEAEAGDSVRLPDAELLGSYAPVGVAGTTVTIFEKDGQLVRRISNGLPDCALRHLKGNRYAVEGLPEEFVISFRSVAGKVELLLESPARTSVVRVKQ